jgi:RNA polymerase sigma-70 factor (ECF subfamily)
LDRSRTPRTLCRRHSCGPGAAARFNGREAIVQSLIVGLRDPGEWRLVPVRANRQPAAASYLRPWGGTKFEAFKFDILRIEGGKVAEITTFDATLFPVFGLPAILLDQARDAT